MKNIYKAGKETGAKIKQFVITRPKLHKVLKTIKIVVNVLVYGFTILMIIGLCVGTTLNNNNNNDGVVKQNAPSYNAIIREDYQLYCINSDLCTRAFIDALLSYEDQRSGFADFTSIYEMLDYGVGATQQVYAGYGNNTVGIFGYYLNFDAFEPNSFINYNLTTNQSAIVKSIVLKNERLYYSSVVNTFSYEEYFFSMDFLDVNYQRLYKFTFLVSCYKSSSGVVQYNFMLEPYMDNNSASAKFILVNSSITDFMGSNLIYTLYQINNPTYKGGYDAGFNAGYNAGFNADSGSNDAFTLIRGAFYAIADILNINVLPHLTLGVLIFAPLIVTLIIVIVKMVRG